MRWLGHGGGGKIGLVEEKSMNLLSQLMELDMGKKRNLNKYIKVIVLKSIMKSNHIF